MKIDLKNKINELRQDARVNNNTTGITVSELKELIINSLDDDKAEDITIIDLAGKSDMADYMIVATGRVSRHVNAIASNLVDKLHDVGYVNILPEGTIQGDWVLIDAFDIIIHIFRPEIRELYNLEKMWKMEIPNTDI
jgi:ribosome-associated protein